MSSLTRDNMHAPSIQYASIKCSELDKWYDLFDVKSSGLISLVHIVTTLNPHCTLLPIAIAIPICLYLYLLPTAAGTNTEVENLEYNSPVADTY